MLDELIKAFVYQMPYDHDQDRCNDVICLHRHVRRALRLWQPVQLCSYFLSSCTPFCQCDLSVYFRLAVPAVTNNSPLSSNIYFHTSLESLHMNTGSPAQTQVIQAMPDARFHEISLL